MDDRTPEFFDLLARCERALTDEQFGVDRSSG